MNRKRRSARRGRGGREGFTLMEVLLVLAILVILGTVVVGNFTGMFATSKNKAAQVQLDAFEKLLEVYYLDVGTYPTSQQGLEALRTQPADLVDPTKWRGPYTRKDIPADPWSNRYIYELLGPNQYKVASVGPDGQLGTDDDITNISG